MRDGGGGSVEVGRLSRDEVVWWDRSSETEDSGTEGDIVSVLTVMSLGGGGRREEGEVEEGCD